MTLLAASAFPRQAGLSDVGPCRPIRSIHGIRDLATLTTALNEGERGRTRIRSHDAEARRCEAAALFPATLLLVDGEVWSAEDAGEPCWEVAFRTQGSGGLYLPRVHVSLVTKPSGGHAFRADRGMEASAFGRDLAARNRCKVIAGDDGRVVEADGRLLTVDEAVAAAGLLLSARRLDYLEGWAPFDAVAAMVSAAKVPTRERDGAWAAGVVHAARRMHEAWRTEVSRNASDWTDGLLRWEGESFDDRPDIHAALRVLRGEADDMAGFAP